MNEDELEDAAPTDEQLASIDSMVTKAMELDEQILALEDHLKILRKEHTEIVEKVLVERLRNAGTSMFRTQSGMSVEIDSGIYVSELKDHTKKAALLKMRTKWLEENNGTALIQEAIELRFDKGQHAESLRIQETLKEINAQYAVNEAINTGSFKAFVNGQIKSNVDVPLEELGLYERTYAKIIYPEAKKGRK